MSTLEATSKDITRIGSIDDALAAGWSKMPVYYSYVLQFQLPLTQQEFNDVFSKSIRLFITQAQQSCPGIQTNIELGSGFEEPFLLCGLGVLAIGEDLSFSQGGTLAAESLLAGSVAPQVLPDGISTAQVDAGFRPARFWYGGATWRFINKFFQAKRFVLRVGRCEIVNENLLEIGMVNQPPVFQGAGDSSISTMPFIRETNDVMNGKELDLKFVPPNTAFTALALGADGGFAPVTSDALQIGQVSEAPNAEVTYGHPLVHNLANRIYCLPQPLLITPYSTVSLEFETVDNDCCLIPAARKAAMITCETPFADAPTRTENGLATEVCTVPGGCVSIGILLKGYVCLARAVADYLINYVCGSGYEPLYQESTYVAGIIEKYGLHDHDDLRGFVGSLRAAGALKS